MPPRRPSAVTRLSLAGLWLAVAAAPATAATFTVTNTGDLGAGSLRQAILDANAFGDASNTIVFQQIPDNSTITLLSPLPDTMDALRIDGATATNLTIRGDATTLFQVASGTTSVVDLALTNGGLVVDMGTGLAYDVSGDQTLNGVVSGGGSLEKLGAATLILLGANTYGGGTTVTAGTLQGNAVSLQGDITLAAGTALVFDQGVDGTFTGTVDGEGRLEKIGTLQSGCDTAVNGPKCFGVLTVTSPLTHTGGTTVSSGVLRIDPDNVPGDVVVGATGALALDLDAGARTFAHDVSGTGGLAKDGPFTLTLQGNNSYTGGTAIGEGMLIADTDSLQGDVVIGDTRVNPMPDPNHLPELVFDQGSDGTFTGDISGTGDVTKQGAGTLILVGTNTYAGITNVKAGTLQGDTNSLQGSINVFGGAGLVFDQATDGTFDGSIGDNGTVEKTGAGRLAFSQLQSYFGLTTVSEGRLDILGDLPNSDVQVDPGAVFGGTGDLLGGALTVDGTLAPGTDDPGSEIATMAAGTLTFNGGASYQVDVDAASGADQLEVTDATIGADVDVAVRIAPGDYTAPVTAPILTASGTCMGAFNPVGTNLAFLEVAFGEPDCSGGTVTLTVQDSGATFADFAQTRNQEAVAQGLDAAEPTATGDLALVFQNLKTLTVEEVPPALDAVGGEQLSAFPTTRLAVAGRFHRSLHERVRGLAWKESEALFAWGPAPGRSGLTASGSPVAPAPPRLAPSALGSALAFGPLGAAVALAPEARATGPGGWIDAFGLFGDLDGNANASGLDYSVAGTSLGVDQRFGTHGVVGAAAGYARTVDLDFDRLAGSGHANTYQGALYAGRSTPRSYLSAAGRFAWSDMNMARSIVIADLDRTAKSDTGGWEAGATVEGGVNVLRLWGFALQPLASFDYVHLETDGYTEKGADSLDLQVRGQSLDSLVSGLGVRLHGTFAMERDAWVSPELRVRWGHEFGDRDRPMAGRLTGAATGGAWSLRGASVPADGLVVGASWTVTTGGNLHAFVDYDAVINHDLVEHSVAVGFRLEW